MSERRKYFRRNTNVRTILFFFIIFLLAPEPDYNSKRNILTYYTPSDPTKVKEPLINRELSDKWSPPKTVALKDRLKEESKAIAIKVLAEGPEERDKRRKK